MKTSIIKTDISNMLKKVEDEKVLRAIQALLKEISNDDIVGYTPNGTPITLSDLQKRLDEAEEDIQKNRVYTSAELKKHFRNKHSK